jgi:HCO3- transporter family
LLNAINNFLDETVVLPPGDWDRKTLLSMSEIHELKMKKRRRIAAMEKLKEEKQLQRKMSEAYIEKKPEVISEKAELEKELAEKKVVETVYNPLERTNVPFGGVINELKKRFPLYKSDLLDSLSLMCIAAVIFIFFAALSGAIAFGGLYGKKCLAIIQEEKDYYHIVLINVTKLIIV